MSSITPTPAAPAAAAAGPAAKPRHALGMPAGSIRAILAFAVLGLLWFMALYHKPGEPPLLDMQVRLAFVYLNILMVLVLAHFFTAHGKSIGRHISTHSPLWLPTGFARVILLVGYIGLVAYSYNTQHDFELPTQGHLFFMLALLLSAYFLGWIIAGLVRLVWGEPPPPTFQDLQAWVGLLAVMGLGVVVLIHMINMSLPQGMEISLEYINAVLASLVGLYFGARS